MIVKQTNGSEERFNPNKIINKINLLSKGLNKIDTDSLSQLIITRVIDGINTKEINELSAQLAQSKITTSYEYTQLAARLLIDNLYKEAANSFYDSVCQLEKVGIISPEFKSKIEGFDIERLEAHIKRKRDFNFDYLGVKTLKKSYLLKTTEKVIETPQYMYMRVACFLSDSEEDIIKLYDQLSKQEISPASPILFNSGTSKSTLISCNLVTGLDSVGYFGEHKDPDSLEGIHELYKQASKLSAGSAGLGIDVTDIRSKKNIIKTSGGHSAGVHKMILKPFNELMRGFNQAGKRNGAAAIYMEPHHIDILDLLKIRLRNVDAETACKDLFTALWIPDLFMEKVQLRTKFGRSTESDWTLFCPKSLKDNGYDLHGTYGEEFNRQYELAKQDPKVEVKETIDVYDIWEAIVKAQIEGGTPYILYKDRVNESNMQSNIGVVKQSNLCVSGESLLTIKDNGTIKDVKIKNVIDTKVTIWNGFEWSEVTPVCTGVNSTLYSIEIQLNSESTFRVLECTDYHKWILEDDIKKRTHQLIVGDKIKSYIDPRTLESIKAEVYSIEKVLNEDTFNRVYCLTEPKRNSVLFNGVLTLNCAEVIQVTDNKTVANCVLSAIPIGNEVYIQNKETKEINFFKLRDSVRSVVKYLNVICDINEYPTPQTKKGGLEQRALAIGLIGLADLFAQLDLPFDSPEAVQLSTTISEHIYYYALEASCDLAKEEGRTYPYFKGSDYEKGILHFDKYGLNDYELTLDWETLKEKIKEYGLLNSLFIGIMPTAGTSTLVSMTEGVEPFSSLIVKRVVDSGEFVVVNKHLINELERLGFWCENLKNELLMTESIQGILLEKYSSSVTSKLAEEKGFEYITKRVKEIKEIYKTVWELKAKPVITMSSTRQPFVDQTQSMNLWMTDPDGSKLTSMHLYGWNQRLKTGIYYLKIPQAGSAQKSLGVTMNTTDVRNTDVDCIGCSV